MQFWRTVVTDDLGPIDVILSATHIDEFTVGGAAVTAAAWFLGPSIKAVRSNVAPWTDYQSANILGLFKKIRARQDELVPLEPVHPRVSAQILETASWSADGLVQEYLAGLVIDAARDADSDSSLFYARIVDRLTSAQVRAHYATYRALLDGAEAPFELGHQQEAERNAVWVPTRDAANLLGVASNEFDLEEPFVALDKDGLLAVHVIDTPDKVHQGLSTAVSEPSIAASCNPLGAALFTRAHGARYAGTSSFFALKDEPLLGEVFHRCAVTKVFGGTVTY